MWLIKIDKEIKWRNIKISVCIIQIYLYYNKIYKVPKYTLYCIGIQC